MSSIRSIGLKIERAEEHLADLHGAIEAWTKAQQIKIVHDHDLETGWHYLRAEPLPDPPGKWVVMLGELAYQLRSALNFAVDGLVIRNNRTPKPTNQFPIFSDTRKAIDEGGMTRCLVGVADEPRFVIEALQPYKRPDRVDLDALEIIAAASNLDKHHDVHAAAVVKALSDTRLDMGKPVRLDGFKIPQVGSPIADTHLLAFRTVPRDLVVDHVKMEPAATVSVVFSNSARIPIGRLPGLIVSVKVLIDLLRPHLV